MPDNVLLPVAFISSTTLPELFSVTIVAFLSNHKLATSFAADTYQPPLPLRSSITFEIFLSLI